jgi:hypothetical protein
MSLKSAKNLAKHEEMWYTFGVMMDLKAFLDKKATILYTEIKRKTKRKGKSP